MIYKTINGYTIKHLIGSGGIYYAENKLNDVIYLPKIKVYDTRTIFYTVQI